VQQCVKILFYRCLNSCCYSLNDRVSCYSDCPSIYDLYGHILLFNFRFTEVICTYNGYYYSLSVCKAVSGLIICIGSLFCKLKSVESYFCYSHCHKFCRLNYLVKVEY